MSDRELLEAAAKAAGNGAEWHQGLGMGIDTGGFPMLWRPLTDDGDALRLAVKLDISTRRYGNIIEVVAPNGKGYGRLLDEFASDDLVAATRRAIVRAAAAIATQGAPE